MESNHTINYLGMSPATLGKTVDRALGVDEANLPRASLDLLAARGKVIWSHEA